MLVEAAKKWDIDLKKSFMIGDRISGIEAGLAAGCKTILVGGGEEMGKIEPNHQSLNLLNAVEWILVEVQN